MYFLASIRCPPSGRFLRDARSAMLASNEGRRVTQTRIVLGPSSRIVGDLLASILEGEPDLRIVARVRDAPAIEAAVRVHDADAVVLAPPEHAGMTLVRSLLEAHPRLRVVLLASDPTGKSKGKVTIPLPVFRTGPST